MKIPAVLTIAGSDSSCGAGIQGDLKTLQAFGVYGLTVLTSITAQDTNSIMGVHDLPPQFVALQIKTVARDVPVNAVKTGMLSNLEIMKAVACEIKNLRLRNLVVDPVMQSKSGESLIIPKAQEAILSEIIPLARIVTPNVPEAEKLSGMAIRSVEHMKQAAHVIVKAGAENVLIKGGHLEQGAQAIDVLYDGNEFHEFLNDRIEVPGGVHGTGCAFSSAIAAGLAKELSLIDAVSQAKTYITQAIIHRCQIGRGVPVLGHTWNMILREKAFSLS